MNNYINNKVNTDQILKPIKNILANKIFKNTGWLFFDKIFRMGVGLIIGVWVARFLGPNDFGLFNYSLAYVSLFIALTNLGIDNLVVGKLVKHPEQKKQILGSAFCLRFIVGLLSVIFCLISILFLRSGETAVQIAVGIISLSCLFQAFDTIDLFFQSQLKSKYTIIAKNSAFILMAALKGFLIINKFPLNFFLCSSILELGIGAFLMIYFYRSVEGPIWNWSWDRAIAFSYLKEGWPFVLSNLLIIIYMRIDQIMLGSLLNNEAVGSFSAAVKISEIWYFIPMVVSTSLYPYLVKKKEENFDLFLRKLQLVYDWATWGSIAVGIFISLTADLIIELLYGVDYEGAAKILSLHIWSGIFVFWGVISNQYLLLINENKISFYKTLLGAIANIILNLVLIPPLGAVGSALATLISYSVVAYFSNALFPGSRMVFRMLSNSFNLTRILKGDPKI